MFWKSTLFWKLVVLASLLFLFFLGLDLMGLSFKLFGKGFAERLIQTTSNPFVGLFIGVLATSLVQSSSTTTSMTVAMVGAGALTVEGAVPIVLGANIGTSVTNTIVSLGHISRPEEFRRAFAGATVHDFFNWVAVLIFMPLEVFFHALSRVAHAIEQVLEGVGGIAMFDPLKAVVRPISTRIAALVWDSGMLTLLLGILAIILALKYLVTFLKSILASKAEEVLHRTLFRSALSAAAAGALITAMVQSSSITTSIVVPLVGAGVLTLEQVFPFTVGANVGTTVTALMASLAVADPSAVTVALTHFCFNLMGGIIIYGVPPIRAIPLFLARRLGNLAARNRVAAVLYVLIVFFGIPLLLLFLTGALDQGFNGDQTSGISLESILTVAA